MFVGTQVWRTLRSSGHDVQAIGRLHRRGDQHKLIICLQFMLSVLQELRPSETGGKITDGHGVGEEYARVFESYPKQCDRHWPHIYLVRIQLEGRQTHEAVPDGRNQRPEDEHATHCVARHNTFGDRQQRVDYVEVFITLHLCEDAAKQRLTSGQRGEGEQRLYDALVRVFAVLRHHEDVRRKGRADFHQFRPIAGVALAVRYTPEIGVDEMKVHVHVLRHVKCWPLRDNHDPQASTFAATIPPKPVQLFLRSEQLTQEEERFVAPAEYEHVPRGHNTTVHVLTMLQRRANQFDNHAEEGNTKDVPQRRNDHRDKPDFAWIGDWNFRLGSRVNEQHAADPEAVVERGAVFLIAAC
mmetsp:Transcript_13747/g.37200  ORF Transcript_13747/g.37200 Transcript_13747/m.37200 type:complete len:355 (-) Transcript_13747:353-1417(-)